MSSADTPSILADDGIDRVPCTVTALSELPGLQLFRERIE